MKAFISLVIAMFVAALCSTAFAGALLELLSFLNPHPSGLLSTFIPVVGLFFAIHLYLVWRFYGAVRHWMDRVG